MKVPLGLFSAALVVAYLTKAYVWVILGALVVWAMLYRYGRLSSDLDH